MSSVVLPQPEAPMATTKSPPRICEIDVREGDEIAGSPSRNGPSGSWLRGSPLTRRLARRQSGAAKSAPACAIAGDALEASPSLRRRRREFRMQDDFAEVVGNVGDAALRFEEDGGVGERRGDAAVLATAEPGGLGLLGRGRERRIRPASPGRRPASRRRLGDRLHARLKSGMYFAIQRDSRRLAPSIALSSATTKSLFFSAQARSTMIASKVGAPSLATSAEERMGLPPEALILARTGSQTNAPSMSPRSQAARISGGRMLMICRSLLSPALSSA